jgi:hypothetical protein
MSDRHQWEQATLSRSEAAVGPRRKSREDLSTRIQCTGRRISRGR